MTWCVCEQETSYIQFYVLIRIRKKGRLEETGAKWREFINQNKSKKAK